jgi:hypothetical protein
MSFHIDQQANYWWKDDQMINKFACLGKIVNPQGKLSCIGVVNTLKTMCNDQGKPISMIESQQFKSIINVISHAREERYQLFSCICSWSLRRFNRTTHPWVGWGGESRPRRAVDGDYNGDTMNS